MSSYRFLILPLFLTLPALAQQGAKPPVPIQGEKLPVANNKAGEKLIVEDITLAKVSGVELAKYYREYTGKRVIVTSSAAGTEMAFMMQASPEDPLTHAEAAELLRKAAVLEGFVFTQHPGDPNLEILTVASSATRPTNVQVDVYNESSKLPDEDIVITYVMTLSYIKPDQAVQVFTQVVGQFGPYASISAVPNASAVVITEKASLIKSLIELKQTIDVPGSVQATRFIQVQYADVTEIATVITEMLNIQQSAQQTAGVQRAPQANAQGAPQGGAAPAGGGVSVPVQVVPEPRTNRIFAMGRPVDLVFVENLVREFDIPTSEKTFLRRKLKFLTVADFLPIAGDALTRAFTGTADGTGTQGSGGGNNRQSNARQTNNGNNNRNNNGNSFGEGGGGVSLGEPDATSAPESLLMGRTLLVADNITNSIVAQGPPPALKIIENLLDQIDVRPDQVMISTIIGQLTLNDSTELGFNYLLDGKDVRGGGGGNGSGTSTGFPVIGPPDVAVGTFPAFNPASLANPGLRVFGTIGDLNAYITALTSKSDFTVLSRPSIFTSNNQKGVISSGERIAIPTEGGTSTGSFSSGTRIQYEEVVLKLEVIPLVNADNEITMSIALLNDEQNGTQVIEGAGTNGGDLTVPRISTREILTTATVPNNKTIVLGGLIVGREGQEDAGIPILSSIPLVGRLFSSKKNTEDRTELMVFIQPTVINSDESLQKVQDDMNNRYDVSDSANGFATDGSPLFGGELPVDPQEEAKPETKAPSILKGPVHRRR